MALVLTLEAYRSHIREESEAFIRAASDGDLGDPVETCPGWTVADLIGHLGVVQRFHGHHLLRARTTRPPGPRPEPPGTGLTGWFQGGVDDLLGTLRTVGGDTPAWNFLGSEPPTTAFWHRRMAHEAAVHRWDAQHARGLAGSFDPVLAADGVDEVLRRFLPVRRPEGAPHGTVVLQLTDLGEVLTTVHGREDAGRVVATGTAGEVLLAVWGRRPWEAITHVEGQAALLHSCTVG